MYLIGIYSGDIEWVNWWMEEEVVRLVGWVLGIVLDCLLVIIEYFSLLGCFIDGVRFSEKWRK